VFGTSLLRDWGRFGGAIIGLLQNGIDSSAFFTEKLLFQEKCLAMFFLEKSELELERSSANQANK
jgi:hypothetical protein